MSVQRATRTPAADGDGSATVTRKQNLFRELNEQIRLIADSFGTDEALELCCECELEQCDGRVTVSHEQYEAVRRFPTRFLVLAEHVGPEERIVEQEVGFTVIEKVGATAQAAILGDPRRNGSDGRHV